MSTKLTLSILTLLVSTSIAACGSSTPCKTSELLGSWVAEDGETLSFGSLCTGTSSLCESTFTYPEDSLERSGSGTVNVLSTTGSPTKCLSQGEHTCAYIIELHPTLLVDMLFLNCGGGGKEYLKK